MDKLTGTLHLAQTLVCILMSVDFTFNNISHCFQDRETKASHKVYVAVTNFDNDPINVSNNGSLVNYY